MDFQCLKIPCEASNLAIGSSAHTTMKSPPKDEKISQFLSIQRVPCLKKLSSILKKLLKIAIVPPITYQSANPYTHRGTNPCSFTCGSTPRRCNCSMISGPRCSRWANIMICAGDDFNVHRWFYRQKTLGNDSGNHDCKWQIVADFCVVLFWGKGQYRTDLSVVKQTSIQETTSSSWPDSLGYANGCNHSDYC